MISKKNIIILLTALILLVVATVFVFMWDGPEVEEQQEEISETIKIFQCNADDITRMVINNPGETIEFVRIDSENWKITGIEDASIKNFSVGMLAGDLASISAKSLVAEKAEKLSPYGLENPSNIAEIYLADGSKKVFLAGDKTALGDGYYCKLGDSDTIYTIYTSLHSSIFASLDDYRDTANLFIDREKITGIRVEKNDYNLNLQLMDEPITMGGYNIATWEMTEPDYNTVDISRLTDYVMDVLPTVTLSSVAGNKSEAAKFGLDKPYAVITVTNLDSPTQVIKLGKTDGDICYIMVDDNKDIYKANSSAFTFVDVDPFLLINKFVNIVNIEDVSNIKVSDGESEFVLAIEGDGDKRKYLFNGAEVEETKFKTEIYQEIIGLTVDKFCSDATYKPPVATVEYNLKDGTYSKAEFVDYNDRNYAVYKDGKCKFIILKKTVNSMLDALKNYK